MNDPMKAKNERRVAATFPRKEFFAWLATLGLILGSAALPAAAQDTVQNQDSQQDQGPPQYPQQDPQQDQGPPQYPQQQQDQGPSQYPQQQDPQQDQGPPQYPQQDQQQGPSQYPQPDAQQAPPQYPQQGQPQYPQQSPAPSQQGPAQSPASVARVSFVQGGVQVNIGGQGAQQAVANMPLIEGSLIQTAQDGQAEIEFGDGSVARLTPNSSLQVNHLGQDSVILQQLSGLMYYELNIGQGHPPYSVQVANAAVQPTSNAIFRVSLDNAPEVAALNGTVEVTGGFSPAQVGEGQAFTLQGNGGAPYAIAQSITQDSWDQWNQDRDQAISQEAAQQTSVRDQTGAPNDENWNDLDYYGNWYPAPSGGGNVWVPSDIGAGWDPYGYGYWGFYPGLGYTWISGYPWGWLPYHCGAWGYYPFGWGWSPGPCRTWAPIAIIHGYPGYFIPPHPVPRYGHYGPVVGVRVVFVDRGPAARGVWGGGHPFPVANHVATLNVGGRVIAPVSTITYHSQAFANSRGTTPGVRTVLNVRSGYPAPVNRPSQAFRAPAPQYQVPQYRQNQVPQNQTPQNRFPQNQAPQNQYPRGPVTNQVPRSQVQEPTQRGPQQNAFNGGGQGRYNYAPHNAPPAPHYSAPPAHSAPTHASAPPPPHASQSNGHR